MGEISVKGTIVTNMIIGLILSCIATGVYTYQMLEEEIPYISCDSIALKNPTRIYTSVTPEYPNIVLYDLYHSMEYSGSEIECINEQHGVLKRYEVILQSIQENNTFDKNNIIHLLLSKGSSLIEYFEIMVFYYICFLLVMINVLSMVDEWLYTKKLSCIIKQLLKMTVSIMFLAIIPHSIFKISSVIGITQSITLCYFSFIILIIVLCNQYIKRNGKDCTTTLYIGQYN